MQSNLDTLTWELKVVKEHQLLTSPSLPSSDLSGLEKQLSEEWIKVTQLENRMADKVNTQEKNVLKLESKYNSRLDHIESLLSEMHQAIRRH